MQQARHSYHLMAKTAAGCIAVMGTNVLGNYALKRGLIHASSVVGWSPIPYLQAFSNAWVLIGVLSMILWFLSRLALLSWADLSYILPVCSLSYVFTAVVGGVVLGEHITVMRWLGTSLVTLGVAVTAVTPPETSSSGKMR